MPDSKYFAIQYRNAKKRAVLMDRLSRRRYVISIHDDEVNKNLVIQVTHSKHRGHLQMICKQFGGAYLGEIDPPTLAVEEEEVVTSGSDATHSITVTEEWVKPVREVDEEPTVWDDDDEDDDL